MLSNFFKGIGAEKWMTFSLIGASLAAVYIGLDLLIATETSLLYRISKSWISIEYHQMGALMIVILFFVFALLMIIKLVNLLP